MRDDPDFKKILKDVWKDANAGDEVAQLCVRHWAEGLRDLEKWAKVEDLELE